MNNFTRLQKVNAGRLSTVVYHRFMIFLVAFVLVIINNIPLFADEEINPENTTNYASLETGSTTLTQTIIMPTDGKAITETIISCNADNKFTDDGVLYTDETGMPRQDSTTICPSNKWQTVKVEFMQFDVAEKDSLIAYDGDLNAVRTGQAALLGKSTGVGASKAFGGWVRSSCSPAINPSGCVTFVFKTNGDYIKSIGWEAWVTCADKKVQITPPSLTNHVLKCGEASTIQRIEGAGISSVCGTITNDTVLVRIANASGKICIDTSLSKNKNMVLNERFGLGTYVVTYKLKSDTTKTAITYFSVNAPNLVCNDNLYIPVGAGCNVQISPDMILENPCDTIRDSMYYQIVVKTLSGQILASGTGKAGDYPEIEKEKLTLCTNNSYQIEITRVFYDGLNLSFCNNGRQAATCNTSVNFKDNTPPFFMEAGSADTVYACNLDLSEEGLNLTRPLAVDNCSKASVVFQKAEPFNNVSGCGSEITYLVHWLAEDGCGNKAILKDTVRVLRPGKDKIVKVPDAILSCGEDSFSELGNIQKTGIPGLMVGIQKNGQFTATDTIPLSLSQYVCNYILQKEDHQIPSGCGTKIFRYWSLVDWCGGTGPVRIDTQLVTLKDTIAPTIICSEYHTLAKAERMSLPAFDCVKNVSLPKPEVSDNCDLNPEVVMYSVEQLENGTWWKIGANLSVAGPLKADTFRVGYRAFDHCPDQIKEDSCYRYFILEDNIKPSVICQDLLKVSLADDFARVKAEDIDAGSWDACGIEKILVRRANCDNPDQWKGGINYYVKNKLNNKLDPRGWGDFVDLGCCDIHKKIKVELLAIDINGNYNYCWMEIESEDKINPICSDLPNQWDYCDNFHNGELGALTDTDEDKSFDYNEWLKLEGDLAEVYNEKYGDPLSACTDNLTCQDYTIEQQYQLIDLECGVYKAKRRYRARDWNGNVSGWSEQYINIEYRPNWKITLPVDWTGTCGDGVPDAELIINNGSCDLMSYESHDQTFEIVNDACFKVIRTYHIINWCKYKAGDQPIQINRIANNEGTVVKNQTISSDQYANGSYFTYIQLLKVVDNDPPEITITEVDDCINNSQDCAKIKSFSVSGKDCNDSSSENLEYRWELFGNNDALTSGYGPEFSWNILPTTNYQVRWKVSDRCGNSAWAEKNYYFRDCTKPVPYCLDGLAIELGSNKEVDIWAADFNINSSDNCTTEDKLDFRIWHHSLGIESPLDLEEVESLPAGLTLSCADLGDQEVYIYVIDGGANYDFCITGLKVQDNFNVCPTTGGQITGKIQTEYGAAVPGVEVAISNMENTAMMTPDNGSYSFDLDGTESYTIKPEKDINMLNGVSTFDLVKMTRHILGQEPFTSPYQYIAADINASGDITTFDIIQLRKLILNLTDRFPDGNTSWRFVDASYKFTTTDPLLETFPEFIEISQLNGNLPDLDFVAIKIGDINGSASTGGLINSESRQSKRPLVLEIEDRKIRAGEQTEVTFRASDFSKIEGYQFTLEFKDLELIEFQEGLASAAHFGFNFQQKGMLTTSWNKMNEAETKENPVLFRLKFKAVGSGSLLSLININSKITAAEAYRKDGSLSGVVLQPGRSATSFSNFLVKQNSPNPFSTTTNIALSLPKPATIKLNVIDIRGSIVLSRTADYREGWQKISIEATDLENGTYYYQIISPFGTKTGKLICIK